MRILRHRAVLGLIVIGLLSGAGVAAISALGAAGGASADAAAAPPTPEATPTPEPPMITLHIREASGLREVRLPANSRFQGEFAEWVTPDGTCVLFQFARPPFSIGRVFGPDGRELVPKAVTPEELGVDLSHQDYVEHDLTNVPRFSPKTGIPFPKYYPDGRPITKQKEPR